MSEKLRIGVLVDSDQVPHWAFEMLERIQRGGSSRIVLLVRNSPDTKLKKRHRARRLHKLLFLVFLRLDRLLFRPSRDPFAKKNLAEALPDVPTLTVTPLQRRWSDSIRQEDLEKIAEFELDVMIRLGFRILRGGILRIAKHGIWSYHHGDNRKYRGGPAGFWEVMEGCPETGVVLQVLTNELDGGRVLYRSYCQTDSSSVTRTRAKSYWKSAAFVPRVLDYLHRFGDEAFLRRVEELNSTPTFYSRRLYRVPGNIAMTILGCRHYWRYFVKKMRALFSQRQWILLFRLNSTTSPSTSMRHFTRIIPPNDRFWADPCVVKEDGKYHVFLEEFEYRKRRGVISHMVIDDSGKWRSPVVVLDKSYHLSHPFVFRCDGDYYMIPETEANRTIELYRCARFPDRWELATILMSDISAVDTVMLHRDGIWWLFANVSECKGVSSLDELFLYYSSDLHSGQWTPHPLNPVVSDVKSARPAGPIFTFDGRLYRPSQNNLHRYGYGMTINRIDRLTETAYEETCVDEILPQWDKDIVATHSFSWDERMTVIDGVLSRPYWFK